MSISAQVDPTQGENEFRGEIQKTLRNFIDGDWKIQSIQRSKGTGKYEIVYVQATARVPERENYQLIDRANAVSRIGFELVGPVVDYNLGFDDIQKINQELRLTLINDALTECNTISEAYTNAGFSRRAGNDYRVSSVRFDNGNNQQVTPGVRAYTASMNVTAPIGATMGAPIPMQSYEDESGGSAPEEPLDVNVSTRFSMIGYFTLRSGWH